MLPGAEGAQAVDAAGASALAVLRSMGLPSVMGVVQNPAGGCPLLLCLWPPVLQHHGQGPLAMRQQHCTQAVSLDMLRATCRPAAASREHPKHALRTYGTPAPYSTFKHIYRPWPSCRCWCWQHEGALSQQAAR